MKRKKEIQEMTGKTRNKNARTRLRKRRKEKVKEKQIRTKLSLENINDQSCWMFPESSEF